MRIWTRIGIASLAAAALSLGCAAWAGQDHGIAPPQDASAWHSNDHSRVRMVDGGQSPAGEDLIGVQFDLTEGWHTYWRSPGRFGIPATFNIEGSQNIRGIDVRWPEPEYIEFDDYEAYGYYDRLMLPIVVSRENPDEAAVLRLAIGYAVCENVCIPATGFVSILLPAGRDDPNPEYEFLVHEALELVPTRDLTQAGVEVDVARVVRLGDDVRAIRVSARSEVAWVYPHLIIEGPKGIRIGRAKLTLDATGRHLVGLVPIEVTDENYGVVGPGFRATIVGAPLTVEVPLQLAFPAAPRELDR